jgi:hypothetical protein
MIHRSVGWRHSSHYHAPDINPKNRGSYGVG